MGAASDRAKRHRAHVGVDVQVRLRSRPYSAEPVVLRGTVIALALRMRGAAEWTGPQYDMVLSCDDKIVRTFALVRIFDVTPLSDVDLKR